VVSNQNNEVKVKPVGEQDVPIHVRAYREKILEGRKAGKYVPFQHNGMRAFFKDSRTSPPLIEDADGTFYYHNDRRGWECIVLLEQFYRSSGALERAKYPPQRWQQDLFEQLEEQIPTSGKELIPQYRALELNAGELRAIGAIEKMFEVRDWEAKYRSKYTTYDGTGPFEYKGKVPNLVFTTSEYLEHYGVPRFVDGTGRNRFSARGRKDAIGALRDLNERSWKIPIKEVRADGRARVVTISSSLILELQEYTNWLKNEAEADEYLLEVQAPGGGGSKTKWFKVKPAPIFFKGILERRQNYTLKPWNLHAQLAAVNGRAARENIAFMEYLLKVVADTKANTPKDGAGKYPKGVFHIVRTDRELARALQMDAYIRARAWKRIRQQLRKRCEDIKRAGFLVDYTVTPVYRYGVRNVSRFELKMNPVRCEYQGGDT
jgi:hypothetical protein